MKECLYIAGMLLMIFAVGALAGSEEETEGRQKTLSQEEAGSPSCSG